VELRTHALKTMSIKDGVSQQVLAFLEILGRSTSTKSTTQILNCSIQLVSSLRKIHVFYQSSKEPNLILQRPRTQALDGAEEYVLELNWPRTLCSLHSQDSSGRSIFFRLLPMIPLTTQMASIFGPKVFTVSGELEVKNISQSSRERRRKQIRRWKSSLLMNDSWDWGRREGFHCFSGICLG